MKKQIRCRKSYDGCGNLFFYEGNPGSGSAKKFCPTCVKKKKTKHNNLSQYYTRSIKNEEKAKQPRRPCIGVLCGGKVEFQPKSRYNRLCDRCASKIEGISDCEGVTPSTRKK